MKNAITKKKEEKKERKFDFCFNFSQNIIWFSLLVKKTHTNRKTKKENSCKQKFLSNGNRKEMVFFFVFHIEYNTQQQQ